MKKLTAKKKKIAFLFNIFLSSLAAKPLEVSNKSMAAILNISESALSKLRHSRTQKLPAGLHPGLMASKFVVEVLREFAPTKATALLFIDYAKSLGEKYILSDSLSRFVSVITATNAVEEEKAKKLYTGMIPELLKLCYEESYFSSEKEYDNWVMSHSNMHSEAVYQKICDMVNQDVLSSERLKQLVNVVYSASVRRQLAQYHSDFSYLEMMNDFFRSQVNQPFYSMIRRSEQISVSDDGTEITRVMTAREQIVPQTMQPVDFTVSQTYYNNSMHLPSENIIETAFHELSCSVNGQPLTDYVNQQENTSYQSLHQFITVQEEEDDGNEASEKHLMLRFTLYPSEAGEPINIEYGYTSTSPFIPNVSCNCFYTLQYPCKFLYHEFALDERTATKWGVRVKLFAPLANSICDRKDQQDSIRTGGSAGAMHVMFYDWAMPGAGYFCNLYERKGNSADTVAF